MDQDVLPRNVPKICKLFEEDKADAIATDLQKRN
jgi:hypothetical protein